MKPKTCILSRNRQKAIQLDNLPTNAAPLHTTTSLCRVCKNAVPATVLALDNNEVWLHKHCADHGPQSVKLSDNADWYGQWYREANPFSPQLNNPVGNKKPVSLGCPYDCGPCNQHQQSNRLPIVTITSACNLSCPKCYVHNNNENTFHMSSAEFQQTLAHIVNEQNTAPDLINFTGGDPTLHPELLDFLQLSQAAGIHRVSICTNGIVLARNEELVKRLAQSGARVALSFDTFEMEADKLLNGASLLKLKHECLELLARHNVSTTLIPVVSKGVNDHELGKLIEYAFAQAHIRHIEFHTITFTGPGGVDFDRGARISMHEVLQRIESQTRGLISVGDFVPSPCAHPLCYQIAYFLMDPFTGAPIAFNKFLDKATVYDCLAERLYLEPGPRLERALRDAIERLWIRDDEESAQLLRALKHLLRELFPQDRSISREQSLRRGEQYVKAIYVHSHMDEETFDNDRIMQCCDSNCYADGSSIPVCAYNVLYRETEQRFNAHPVRKRNHSGGQRPLNVTLAP